jgi:hypothetical protein
VGISYLIDQYEIATTIGAGKNPIVWRLNKRTGTIEFCSFEKSWDPDPGNTRKPFDHYIAEAGGVQGKEPPFRLACRDKNGDEPYMRK